LLEIKVTLTKKRLREVLAKQDLKLITKTKKNLKEKALSILDKLFLSKRGIVATVIDQLKSTMSDRTYQT
jgi:hypothetical protein